MTLPYYEKTYTLPVLKTPDPCLTFPHLPGRFWVHNGGTAIALHYSGPPTREYCPWFRECSEVRRRRWSGRRKTVDSCVDPLGRACSTPWTWNLRVGGHDTLHLETRNLSWVRVHKTKRRVYLLLWVQVFSRDSRGCTVEVLRACRGVSSISLTHCPVSRGRSLSRGCPEDHKRERV